MTARGDGMKIAVVGAGSSGLVTLKYLLDAFPEAEVTCFEKTHSVRGCWGDQRPDFVSTSTKYTTQFSCFRQWEPVTGDRATSEAFFQGGEFGDYLEAFAAHFGLTPHVRFGTAVRHLAHDGARWRLQLAHDGEEGQEAFDAVFLCTGLVNRKVASDAAPIPAAEDPEAVRDATVVVVGGGESAADLANHLARPEHGNTVYLSLRSGIRVSPRYHPIRGVPSDFLRNRLLLSFDRDLRNRLGERFVGFRIRFDRLLERWFPHPPLPDAPDARARALRRRWDLKLKARAKGKLFNVFHNKSDDFLDAVGEERIQIVGPPADDTWTTFFDFDRTSTRRLTPDVLVWSTGYRSGLPDLADGRIRMRDCYYGCVHTDRTNLFLIGFARPIIGNIPSISEMQARYAVGVLAGRYALPDDLQARQAAAWTQHCADYPTLDTDNVYPVEQYPYCDLLAAEMGLLPTRAAVGSRRAWRRIQLAPASTTQYVDAFFDPEAVARQPVYMPPVLVALLYGIRVVGYPARWGRRLRRVLSREA